MAVCGQCGGPLEEGVKFCGFCGKPADASPEGQAPTDTDETLMMPPEEKVPAAAPPPPPPPPPAAAPAKAGPGALPPKPGQPPKKSGGKGCIIAVLIFVVVGFLLVAVAGVGGYFYMKKKGLSLPFLHRGEPQVTEPAEGQPPQEEAAPSQQESTEPSQPEQAQPEPAQPETPAVSEPPAPQESAPEQPKPKPKQPKPKPVQPQAAPAPETVPAPAPQAAPAEETPQEKVRKAPFGLIFETSAYATRIVVKVDGAKVFEQPLSPTGSKMRVAQELATTPGHHHIRVAAWRAQGEPVAQEFDFTFEAGQHPVFQVNLSDNWVPSLKRLE